MISEIFTKLEFHGIHTADIRDGNVTNRASVPPNLSWAKMNYSFLMGCAHTLWGRFHNGCSMGRLIHHTLFI